MSLDAFIKNMIDVNCSIIHFNTQTVEKFINDNCSRDLQFHRMYLNMAKLIGELSYANRTKVGSIIVKDDSIISMGYNGTPHKWDNKCEDENNKTLVEVLHAESNALMKIACSTMSSQGATIYNTLSPCVQCAKLISQAKIKAVYFSDIYKDTTGIEFLVKCKIDVYQIKL